MRHWFGELDNLLRGDLTRPEQLSDADIRIQAPRMVVLIVVLAMIYGLCMGSFALLRGAETANLQDGLLQTVASMIKVPVLILLTLLVTFPSLYVFNALVGSQLRFKPVLRLLIAFIAVNAAILASLGPIVAFFSVSTPNYSFVVLLNVVVMSVAGLLGLGFLVQTLNRLAEIQERAAWQASLNQRHADQSLADLPAETQPSPEPSSRASETSLTSRTEPTGPESEGEIVQASTTAERPTQPPVQFSSAVTRSRRLPGPLESQGSPLASHTKAVFACWTIAFGLVGAQMGWMLRPFIGAPGTEFQWLRPRDSNFFEAFLRLLGQFLPGS